MNRLHQLARRALRKLRGARSRPVPLSELAEYVLEFCSGSDDARHYAEFHLGRLVRTLEITPRGSAQDCILEMGAYMQITAALNTKLGYGEVRGCYLGPLGKTEEKTVTSSKGETFSCAIDLFNAERDRYPYPDGHFSAIICSELFEHLADDPMHLLAEANRVLRPGGSLVLSTPNICALRGVAAVLEGRHPEFNSYYTARKGGNLVEPRHSREYTPREIGQLLEAAGFDVELLETGAYGMQRPEEFDWALTILRERGFSTELRDDVIHAVGRESGVVRERFPSWLYA